MRAKLPNFRKGPVFLKKWAVLLQRSFFAGEMVLYCESVYYMYYKITNFYIVFDQTSEAVNELM